MVGWRSLAYISSCRCYLYLGCIGTAFHHLACIKCSTADSKLLTTERDRIIFRCRPHPRSSDPRACHHPALTGLFLRALVLPRYPQTAVKVHTFLCWYVPAGSSMDHA